MTDEIFEAEVLEDGATAELHAGSFNNEWGEKLSNLAPGAESFNVAFTRTELGDGQVMSASESSRIIAQSKLRENAGNARNAQLDADLTWADVRIKEQKLTGKQLEVGIQKATNVRLGNELLYQVGRIGLHAEKRHLQLHQLNNQVKGLRESVKINATRLSIEQNSEPDIDFNEIKVEE